MRSYPSLTNEKVNQHDVHMHGNFDDDRICNDMHGAVVVHSLSHRLRLLTPHAWPAGEDH